MKIMSRNFSLQEKILLTVLAIILLALGYYYFVDIPVRQSIVSSEAETAMLQTELQSLEQRVMYLKGIRNSLDELESMDNPGWMGSYNNSKAEVQFLNDVLAHTVNYSIAFANVTRSGDQIRRNFTLQFQTADYPEAQAIMTQLLQGENRCLVGDMRCTIGSDGIVTINATATFYETMVGGVPDAGLPADGATVNQ